MPEHTFGKAERLCRKKLISSLFAGGESFARHPVRIVWSEQVLPEPVPCQVTVSVPKKNFKRANKRNLLRRRVKEAWRLNKHLLYPVLEAQGKQLAILFIYQGKDIFEYASIEKRMKEVIKKMIQHYTVSGE
jgi:ribonuclease P protein component